MFIRESVRNGPSSAIFYITRITICYVKREEVTKIDRTDMNYKYIFLVPILLFVAVIADHCVYFCQWYRDEFWYIDHIFMSYNTFLLQITPRASARARVLLRVRLSRCLTPVYSRVWWELAILLYSALVQVNQIRVKHRIERIASFFERRGLASRGSPRSSSHCTTDSSLSPHAPTLYNHLIIITLSYIVTLSPSRDTLTNYLERTIRGTVACAVH